MIELIAVVIAVLFVLPSAADAEGYWQGMPGGRFRDISAKNGNIWAIDIDYVIHHFDHENDHWQTVTRNVTDGSRISAAPRTISASVDGAAWLTVQCSPLCGGNNCVYRWDPESELWEPIPGYASQVKSRK